MENKRKTGAGYEALCAGYLEQRGYSILERNFRSRYGEIDIIALDGETIVFVEVKYRSRGGMESALAAVDAKKQRRIAAAAQYYIMKNRLWDRMCRFDVCALAEGHITHIENAFDV